MHGITSLSHAVINVKNLERSLTFYTEGLEFPEMLRLYNDDGSTRLVYLRITDDQYLELFPGAEQERARRAGTANGVTHLCLTVVDIDTVVKRLTGKGIKMLMPIKDGLDGNRQAWIEDPDGNRHRVDGGDAGVVLDRGRVSRAVNSVKNDTPECIEPVAT